MPLPIIAECFRAVLINRTVSRCHRYRASPSPIGLCAPAPPQCKRHLQWRWRIGGAGRSTVVRVPRGGGGGGDGSATVQVIICSRIRGVKGRAVAD